jgi:glucoamylase
LYSYLYCLAAILVFTRSFNVDENNLSAPGWPGIPPTWTSSAKSGVGTALNPVSHVWFTISHGIFNEIYYPRLDTVCIRDLELIITDGDQFFSEEKRNTDHQIELFSDGVPAYRLVNTCVQNRYRIEKEIVADPWRDCVLQQTRFTPIKGEIQDYRLYVLLAPHLGNQGKGNTAWIGDYKGVPMLFAERNGYALALVCSVNWLKRSAGFVGSSDGWQDLSSHKKMTWTYDRAENGNVALIGEVNLPSTKDQDGGFLLILGFGSNTAEAGQRALSSLFDGFEQIKSLYVKEWQDWQKTLGIPKISKEDLHIISTSQKLFHISAAVLRTHEAKHMPGGLIASLSIPWGMAKGDDDLGGYHLVWPRDLVESAGGLFAIGAYDEARRVLKYLYVTQESDGRWPQNMWLDGQSYWGGIQMDETAFPILLVDLANREGVLTDEELEQLWSMVRRAASFIVQNGPVTQQDRWEEDPGYSPFTLAVEIAALLVAADMADKQGETTAGKYLRETAEVWYSNIDRWTYVKATDLAHECGVEGYYVRIAPPETAEAASPKGGFVPIKNRPPGENTEPAIHLVSPDALALVRLGLRAPDDPRIVNTIQVIDRLLKVDTPFGPAWHRYNGDGYGEQADGSPFNGTGIGRLWPLLTGERAHYELAAGHRAEADKLLHSMEAFVNDGGLLPEQIWDSPDIPDLELTFGKPSGSAMPLVWAHAEYVKLCHSLLDGCVFDTPPQTVKHFIDEKFSASPYTSWRFNHKCQWLQQGTILRVELLKPAIVHWNRDGWQNAQDTPTRDTGLGMYIADLDTQSLQPDTEIEFTFLWSRTGEWEGQNYSVKIISE